MKFKINFILLIIFTAVILFVSAEKKISKQEINDWENELNGLGFLVLKSSAVNIINGLNLTREQANALRDLALTIEAMGLPVFQLNTNAIFNETAEIKAAYIKLLEYLNKGLTVPKDFQVMLFNMRRRESEIIKNSVWAAKKINIKNSQCIRCHANPDFFYTGDIAHVETASISTAERRDIDITHVIGIFGQKGTAALADLKGQVDKILSSGQKYILKDFRCCLVPPQDLENSANVGQAFVSDEWLGYFDEVRTCPDDHWNDFRHLFIYPVDDYIASALPGIKRRYRKIMMKNVGNLLDEIKKMDDVDYTLQKKMLCIKLKDALDYDFLVGEDSRTPDERQFLAAMYLLCPGTVPVYDKLIKNIDAAEKAGRGK